MNKAILMTAIMTAVAGTTFANVVTGPIEPGTANPIVNGYNSIASGQNTVVDGTSTTVLGRDNIVTGDDTTVIGANNGTVNAGQSAIIGYNNKVDASREQVIIGANSETAGQGSTVIGTHSKAVAWDAVAIGNNAVADKANSVALGTNSVTDDAVAVHQAIINGVTHTFAGDNPSAVVSVGANTRSGGAGITNYTRQITNVSAGQVSVASTDAVNGSQLFAVADEVNTIGGKLNTTEQKVNTNTQAITKVKGDINCLNIRVDRNVGNIKNLTSKVDNGFTTINNTLANQNSRIASNTNAISENKSRLDNHEHRITDLENKTYGAFNNVMHEVAKAGAANAALSALHYIGYNSDDKLTFSAGYGHYKNANAVALGAFYAPTEHIVFSIGTTLGAANMINAGVSFRLGKGSEYELNHNGKIKQLEQLVNELLEEVQTLKEGK